MYRAGGWGFLGCRRRPRPREELPPRQPLGPSARASLVWPAGSTSGFHFSLRSETKRQKTRENNKTLQCEVNGAVRSVGRAGLGRSKRARRDWRRGQKVGRPPLDRCCTRGAAVGLRQRAELRGREAPACAAGWAKKAPSRLRLHEPPALPAQAASQAGGRAPSAGHSPLSAAPATPKDSGFSFWDTPVETHPLLAPLGRWG